MNNYSNNKQDDPHAITRMALLETEVPALTWIDYCWMLPAYQLVWEERGNGLNKALFYLMNSKNKNAKRDLCLAYSEGNITAYSPTIKGMTKCLSTQYPNIIRTTLERKYWQY